MSRQLAEGDKSKVGKGVLRAKLAAEPHPQSGLPPAPEYLPERAREAYEFWRAELRLMQLDHRPDGPALAAAALAYSRAIEAEMLIMREGVIVKDAIFYRGKRLRVDRVRKHPALGIATSNWLLMASFLRQFGLTPLARSRLTVDRKQ